MGHTTGGSYSLGSDKTKVFSTLVGAILDDIEYVMNSYAIPRLFARNTFNIERLPVLKHGDLEKLELTSLMLLIQSAKQHGMPLLTMDVVNYVFRQFGIPEFKTEDEFQKALENSAKFSAKGLKPSQGQNKEENNDDNQENN
jgi:hypothetical protein